MISYDRKRRIAVAVRWTALEQPITLASLIGLERSHDVDEIGRRVRTLVTPALNVMAADVDGHARYQTAGALPRRGFDPGFGVLPGDGRHESARGHRPRLDAGLGRAARGVRGQRQQPADRLAVSPRRCRATTGSRIAPRA